MALLPVVLKGDALARAYANMDVFTFPSRTDTFGNVVLEALASGVPAVVTNEGGPKFIIRNGETGFAASDVREFSAAVHRIATDASLLAAMRIAARQSAMSVSWDAVFENVYLAYERSIYAAGRPVRPSTVRGRVPARTLAQ